MTPEQYHADTTRVSKSGLDLIAINPKSYWRRYLAPEPTPQDEKKDFIIGDIYHNYILELDTFKQRFAEVPSTAPKYPTAAQWNAENPSVKSKAAMTWWTEFTKNNSTKKIIKSSDLENVKRMRDELMKNPEAKFYIEQPGVFEAFNEWTEPETGAPCKNKFDKVIPSSNIIIDLKSAKSAEHSEFAKSVVNYRYDVQGAFYCDGYFHGMGNGNQASFLFIAQEKVAPFSVGLYWLTPEIYNRGRRDYLNDCATYMNCKSTGVWPGYNNDKSVPLQLPGWAK